METKQLRQCTGGFRESLWMLPKNGNYVGTGVGVPLGVMTTDTPRPGDGDAE